MIIIIIIIIVIIIIILLILILILILILLHRPQIPGILWNWETYQMIIYQLLCAQLQGTERVRRRTWPRRWWPWRPPGQRASGPRATPHPPGPSGTWQPWGHFCWPKICQMFEKSCTMYASESRESDSELQKNQLWLWQWIKYQLGLCWRYHVVVHFCQLQGSCGMIPPWNPNDFTQAVHGEARCHFRSLQVLFSPESLPWKPPWECFPWIRHFAGANSSPKKHGLMMFDGYFCCNPLKSG